MEWWEEGPLDALRPSPKMGRLKLCFSPRKDSKSCVYVMGSQAQATQGPGAQSVMWPVFWGAPCARRTPDQGSAVCPSDVAEGQAGWADLRMTLLGKGVGSSGRGWATPSRSLQTD